LKKRNQRSHIFKVNGVVTLICIKRAALSADMQDRGNWLMASNVRNDEE
jgi:hypothetical protein